MEFSAAVLLHSARCLCSSLLHCHFRPPRPGLRLRRHGLPPVALLLLLLAGYARSLIFFRLAATTWRPPTYFYTYLDESKSKHLEKQQEWVT